MSDDKNPIEAAVDQAMDAFVYAPIGLVFDGPALFPKLVEKGRTQVQVARMMGKMAVQMGQSEAEKRLSATEGPLREVFAAMGVVPPEPTRDQAPDPEPTVTSTRSTKTSAPRAARPAAKASTKKAGTKKAGTKRPATKRPATKRAATKRAVTTSPTSKRAAARTRPDPEPVVEVVAVTTLGIPDYDSLSASQVVKRLRGMDTAALDAVRAYEAATRARKTILNRIAQIQKD